MEHKFDVTKRRKLDSAERRKILPPFETLKKVGLQEGDIMADIGCGIGYFTLPAAEIVGPRGLIYAMDISPEMLAEVEKRAADLGTRNIRLVNSGENEFKIKEETVNFAFICLVMHEAKNITSFLQETKRITTGQGRVAIIEWKKVESSYGPPVDHRLDIGDVKKIVQDLGFKNVRGMDIGEQFYAVVAQKGTD
ncbi:MAG: class I SAM-dependent methyltransferase [Thermincola sp.]|jgi:ubiquinone/menaquinone biosynthesis C-methylase UbiE|nr:class I SAM-dependent methyltransferase [Thermincola sp.]MDT3702426.1 class I SAM-dependent methyltransferase [Thermincola sp.]